MPILRFFRPGHPTGGGGVRNARRKSTAARDTKIFNALSIAPHKNIIIINIRSLRVHNEKNEK